MKASVFSFLILSLGFVLILDFAYKKVKPQNNQEVSLTPGDISKYYFTEDLIEETSELKVDGLNYEIEIMDIYMGNFSEIPWERDNMIFGLLLNSYINNFAKRCDAYLPKDKEMLYEQQCAEKQITKNGYGMIINETCLKYTKVPLYLYVAPDMARAKEEIEAFQLKWIGDMMKGSDGLGTSAKLMSQTKAITLDMAKLLQMNSCDSPALQRFQENLRRYAHDLAPIKMEKLIAERNAGLDELSSDQNLQQLLEDLVYQNSKQWNFNRFHKGSVQNVNILSTDFQGRPGKVKASYTFSGFSGTKNGSVTLTFNHKGLPDCLFFFDFPTTCRPANQKIVLAYARNEYANSLDQASTEINNAPNKIMEEQNFKRIAANQNTESSFSIPFTVIEEPPLFPSCETLQNNSLKKKCTSEKISQFVNKNFNLRLVKELGLAGVNRIIVQFKINSNGKIEDIKARAAKHELENEAIRIVNLLPQMLPGKQRGQTVAVAYSLPIAIMAEKGLQTANLKNNAADAENKKSSKPETKDPNSNELRQLFNLKRNKDN